MFVSNNERVWRTLSPNINFDFFYRGKGAGGNKSKVSSVHTHERWLRTDIFIKSVSRRGPGRG